MVIIQRTHQKLNNILCGNPIELKENYSKLSFITTKDMIVDETNLIHGGFIFGLADYAAMVAINHPNVVLGGANVRFIKPVILGDKLIAEAKLKKVEGKKHVVEVTVNRKEIMILKGDFFCYVPDVHVLSV